MFTRTVSFLVKTFFKEEGAEFFAFAKATSKTSKHLWILHKDIAGSNPAPANKNSKKSLYYRNENL